MTASIDSVHAIRGVVTFPQTGRASDLQVAVTGTIKDGHVITPEKAIHVAIARETGS
jgi:hypothetical protein